MGQAGGESSDSAAPWISDVQPPGLYENFYCVIHPLVVFGKGGPCQDTPLMSTHHGWPPGQWTETQPGYWDCSTNAHTGCFQLLPPQRHCIKPPDDVCVCVLIA